MGDNVNLGSRLEGLNKQYGTNIIVSEFTTNQISDGLIVRELDLVRVKGKEQAVKIYELMGRGNPTHELSTFLEHYQAGVQGYRCRAWDKGIEELQQALDLMPEDYPARMYLNRCIELKANPPDECWDCIYTLTTK